MVEVRTALLKDLREANGLNKQSLTWKGYIGVKVNNSAPGKSNSIFRGLEERVAHDLKNMLGLDHRVCQRIK